MAKIKTTISCENIAPLENLTKEIESKTLKIGILADNGSGKTFISRMFRLTEKLDLEDEGKSTDKLITFKKTSAKFSFKIIDKENNIVEDFNINLNSGFTPSIPTTNFIYHTFNQDFVDDNIKTLSFEKDGNIDGFILGKANIDVSEDEEKLLEKETITTNLIESIQTSIGNTTASNLDSIQNIKRLSDYKKITYENIYTDVNKDTSVTVKSLEEWISDYNKVKAIPENLIDIEPLNTFVLDLTELTLIVDNLKIEFKLSDLAYDFKEKVKSKQFFIETGLEVGKDNDSCPFCEQVLSDNALSLIDKYNEFLKDEESKTIKNLKNNISKIQKYKEYLTKLKNDSNEKTLLFNKYKNDYISSMSHVELESFEVIKIEDKIDFFINKLEEKIANINLIVLIEDNILNDISILVTELNLIIENINKSIKSINSKKNKANDENKNIRVQMCKTVYNSLIDTHKEVIQIVKVNQNEITELKNEIKRKKSQQRISKKDKVFTTIKSVLQHFFNDKYTLDEDSFRLIFKNKLLANGQTQDVLSEGEKNIIAFAYYLGDIHLKVDEEDDYEKLFFIIDDPISSMDFSHVYTISGVIRDIDKILNLDRMRKRILVFTHNNDFMRVLASNNIIETKLILKNNELKEFKNNLTVPYINHLLDIYKIARQQEEASHTTANSIRHILETLIKFDKITLKESNISEYIQEHIPTDRQTYTLINDLSHGGWRTEQTPISNDDFTEICETLITHIESKYSGQIKYCEELCD